MSQLNIPGTGKGPRQENRHRAGNHVDRRSADHLVRIQTDAGKRMQQRKDRTDDHGDKEADPYRATTHSRIQAHRTNSAGETAHDHQAFQPDIDHAATLAIQAAERSNQQWHGQSNGIGKNINDDMPHFIAPCSRYDA